MKPSTVTGRREFLQATGVLSGVLAAASPWALLAPSRAWAVDLTALSTQQGAALMAAARTIAPHDQLEDAAYALVVHSMDAAAARDGALRKQLQDGIAALGEHFAADSEARRVAALQRVESTAFFRTVRTQTLQILYATPMAARVFGYEGEAFSKGGYLLRGFNDLRWLPEVPLADSGPVPGEQG